MTENTTDPSAATYKDEDLVYVDPKERKVVGIVEWSKAGNPKPLPMKDMVVEEEDDAKEDTKSSKDADKGKRRVRRQRFYPWGTYRSMKRIYKLEGKVPREENTKTLDEVIEKALNEPFWD